jgi:hypothetical protein
LGRRCADCDAIETHKYRAVRRQWGVPRSGHHRWELKREDSHADKVAAVDALEASSNNRTDSKQCRRLRRPVPARSGTVVNPREDDQRNLCGEIGLRRFVDWQHPLAIGGPGVSAGLLGMGVAEQQVPQVAGSERASKHYLVIASARRVLIEVCGRFAAFEQPPSCHAFHRDATHRRNMVCCNVVAKNQQCPRASYGKGRRRLLGDAVRILRPA